MKIWRLKKGGDRRFRQGHPWIFSGEVAHSTKEVTPGEIVELRDSQDHFLAYGYAHPRSQICFRKLSSRNKDKDVLSVDFFKDRLEAARLERLQSGWASASHRWVYAEADGIPGLIVDAFLTEGDSWVAVVQASTAGIERAIENCVAALKSFAANDFNLKAIVLAPTSKARVQEGLEVAAKKIVWGEISKLNDFSLFLRHGVRLNCDLLEGQKTGFFLDQQWNAEIFRGFVKSQSATSIKVLDICCYVGQWAAHVTTASEAKCEVDLLDASEEALGFAKKNLERLNANVNSIAGDALKKLSELTEVSYDVVICDPPAFVKKKLDKVAGLRAYVKLNREAMRLVKPGGLFVASSCSGQVREADWQQVLAEAAQKAGRTFKQLARGGHGPDHPIRAEFPEGEYLKCQIGRIHYPY